MSISLKIIKIFFLISGIGIIKLTNKTLEISSETERSVHFIAVTLPVKLREDKDS
jgi:hypothetical protein